MIQRFCAHQGCPELVTPPERYCPKHKPEIVHETAHHNPFYSTARWQKFRNWYIAGHPLCEMCGAPGTLVDHIQELKDGGEELDPANSMTLCSRCHAKKTRKEKKRRGLTVWTY